MSRGVHILKSPWIVTHSIFYFINCRLLQGKPKFFIVQACRGDDTDVSFPENVEMFSDLGPRQHRKRTRGDYDTVPIPSYGELNTARPTWEDMIIAYSTIPGKLKPVKESPWLHLGTKVNTQ